MSLSLDDAIARLAPCTHAKGLHVRAVASALKDSEVAANVGRALVGA
jgi:hypothetical protein